MWINFQKHIIIVAHKSLWNLIWNVIKYISYLHILCIYIYIIIHLKSSIFLSLFFSPRKDTKTVLINLPRPRLLFIYKIVQFDVSLPECWLRSYPAVFTYAIAKQSYSPYGHNQIRGKGSTSSASAASFGGFVLPGGMFLLIYETQRTLYRLRRRLG